MKESSAIPNPDGGRRINGSSEEQLQDEEEYGAHELTEEQIIYEKKPR